MILVDREVSSTTKQQFRRFMTCLVARGNSPGIGFSVITRMAGWYYKTRADKLHGLRCRALRESDLAQHVTRSTIKEGKSVLNSMFQSMSDAADIEVERCVLELRRIRKIVDVRHDFTGKATAFVKMMGCHEEFEQLYGEFLGRRYGEGPPEPIGWMETCDLIL